MKKRIHNLYIIIVLVLFGLIEIQANEIGVTELDMDPVILATPNPMEFDDTFVGEFTQQLLIVENTGTSTLEVTSVSTTDPAFLVLVNPFTLEPGETQSFIVRFQPIETGYVEGFVQIDNNSSVNPFEVALSGTGLEPGGEINANPNPLVFDDTYIASSSQKNLLISNTGLVTLTISDFIFTNSSFEAYNNPPIILEPGETYDMVIHFKPFELGLIEGYVQFISNDPVNPTYEVHLSGTSIDDPINGWEWHYTGYNFILMDMAFPEGQNQIGYCVGQSYTYNGDGIVIKTTDGGDTWEQMTSGTLPGLQGCSFVSIDTGYAVGWDGYMIKTTDGGVTWNNILVASGIYELTDVEFRDVDHGVVLGDATAFVTSDGGDTWIPATGITTVGYQLTYADDNTLFIAGNENYIFKSIDGGINWFAVNTGMIGEALLGVDFLNADYGIVVGDLGYMFKTTDGGNSWTSQMINDNLFHGVHIWDEDTAWVVGTPDLIYKTTDGGENWESQYPSYSAWKALYKVVFTDNYTGFICGGSNGIVLRKEGMELAPEISTTPESIEFEDTFVGEFVQELLTVENTGTTTLEVTDVSVTDPSFLVLVNPFTLEPGETQSFIVRFQPLEVGFIEGFVELENNSPENPFQVPLSGTGIAPAPVITASPDPLVFDDTYIGSSSQKNLFITNTGLATLTISDFIFPNSSFETYNNPPITLEPNETHDMVIHFKPFELGVIEGGVQFISNDPENPIYEVQLTGNSINDPINGWEWIYTGYNYILEDIEFPEGQNQVGYTVGESYTYNGEGIVLKTTNSGETWEQMTANGIPGLNNCSFPAIDTGYAAGWDGYMIKTTDGGNSWEILTVANNLWRIASLDFKDVDHGVVIAFDTDGVVFVTSDGGESWTLGSGLTAFEDVTYAGNNTYYATGYSDVCKSTDGGLTWTTVYTQGALLIALDFLNPDCGIAAGDYGQVITTKDGGETWEVDLINDILFHRPFIWDEDTAWVVGTPEYVYKTTNSGLSWESAYDGNWMKAFYTITFTDNYTGFICAGSNGIVLRKEGLEMVPAIAIEPAEIIFDTTNVGVSTEDTIVISNTGLADLEVTNINSTNTVFSINLISMIIEPGNTQEVVITFTPEEKTWYEGILQIESNDPDFGIIEVDLSGYGYIITNINDANLSDKVIFYPNPVKDYLYLDNVKGSNILLYDFYGNLKLKLSCNNNSVRIDVSNFAQGTYVMKVVNDNDVFVKKIEIVK